MAGGLLAPQQNITYLPPPRSPEFCLLHVRPPVALTRTFLYFQATHTTVYRILWNSRHNSRTSPNAMNSQAPQLIDCPEIAQSLLHGSQTSEGSASIAPQAPNRRIYNSPNTISQLPQPDRRPGYQSLPSGSPEVLPELPSWLVHRPFAQYPEISTPPLQASSSIPPSVYAPSRTQQDLVYLDSQASEQYAASQISNRYPLPSSYFEAIPPSNHSHQKYDGEGTTTSFRGSEGSRSGYGWLNYNGDGTPLTSMDAYGRRIVQASSRELHNPGAEQGNEQGPNVLSEIGSWGSPRVPGGANVSGNHHRSDGIRYSFNRRSATDQHEGPTIDPSLIWNPVPVENSHARQNQGIHSQEISWPVDQSARGIDPSLQSRDFAEMLGSFVENANNTNTNPFDSENEDHPHDLDDIGKHCPSSPLALAPNYAPEPRNILSSIQTTL